MNVAILGCGPSGLLAALAAEQVGAKKIRIISSKVKSEIPGAVFLHKAIEGATDLAPQGEVNFAKIGNRGGYAHKVYGDSNAVCSWDEFPEGVRPAWSMAHAYHRLWMRYEDKIIDHYVEDEVVGLILGLYDMVISTIPAQAICCDPDHRFEKAAIWTRPKEQPQVQDNEIIYNGRIEDPWYRSSLLFGRGSTERAAVKGYDGSESSWRRAGWVKGFKPTKTDCDCWQDLPLWRVGRFGLWQKGVLAHHAYDQALNVMRGAMG